ncbi:hypothetical protein BpHYR1_049023 [Brachionus plicatilis]|uniref:Uncharacterized protein n=1 Tax=Brachionus plicatilis TaxID=10195 RepID=A0A3M7RMD0_BRAPC|nr:hypothetical protein BpHYR1_049023 [Brachionus plicatilis]
MSEDSSTSVLLSARTALERNSIILINRQIDNLNQHEVLQEVAITIQIVNYSIVNVSNQNQLVLASSSRAVQDHVENNIQVPEKPKRRRPKKSSYKTINCQKGNTYSIIANFIE